MGNGAPPSPWVAVKHFTGHQADTQSEGKSGLSTRTQQFMNAARQVAGEAGVGEALGGAAQQAMGGEGGAPGFDLNERDFPSAGGESGSPGTQINSDHVPLDEAAERLSRSHYDMGASGPVHVITPMVMPKGRKLRAMLPVILLVVIGIAGSLLLLPFDGMTLGVFGPHFWVLVVLLAAFM